ncbi:glycoside hydrolase family 10 protein [Ktedonobacter racemifer]|uniref:Glycosyl hydrolase-like 10 domain-containing protein n=1 Tax=Ktedonobacter racemifer DSM 44963 TaxID=485913 RepID=D6U6Q3_KTERA|nr:family 10 glycosylhydrolase [Ktedonobacter racemifer]EFH80664.1 protein of unknown function DUF187 [Ktedonobacter racemifer DSM 44963]
MRLALKRLHHLGKHLSIGVLICTLMTLGIVPGTASAHETSKTSTTANHALSSTSTDSPKRQLRAAWIATVTNIDWPSQPGLPAATQQQEYLTHLDELQQMNMNAVVVQVKPTADAFYPSHYGPWSQYLTGVQGKDPGYDPLAFMVNETHKRNIEFHAWFNPYRVSMQGDINQLVPDHPARLHPDWVVSYGGKLYYNPGIPAAREFVVQSILEVVRNYDVDGIHLDDYFYPYKVGNQDFPDDATYQQYGAARFANKDDWRRDNVNQMIQELSSGIKQIKPYVKFGISPFGVWRNRSVDPTGSDTTAGQTNYDTLYADTRLWIKNNWLDYIAPQIYWNIGFAPAAYDKLVSWWANEVAGTHVQLYIGQGAYKIGTSSPTNWLNPDEMPNQLALNLQYPQVQGSIFFSLKDLNANLLGFKDRLVNDIYKQKALVPTMPWLDSTAPRPVVLLPSGPKQDSASLRWLDLPHNTTAYYVIYRFDGKIVPTQADFDNSANILTTLRKLQEESTQQQFVDTSAQSGHAYTYYVTAVDRLHNESQPSSGRSITLA